MMDDRRARISKLLHSLADEIMALLPEEKGSGHPAPSPVEEDRLLTPEEAATFLNLTAEQLRRRNIPKKKLGRRTLRYSLAALRRYLART